jgi:spermidine synthase
MQKYGGELVHRRRSGGIAIEVVQDATRRTLHFGNATRQSSMRLDAPAALELAYTRYMMAALLFQGQPGRVLLVGLGGGSLVRFLRHHYPDCAIDVAEPWPAVTAVCRRWFDLPDDPGVRVLKTDLAGVAAGAAGEAYDLVLVDAYDAAGMVPEAADRRVLGRLAARLAGEGVLAVNLSRQDAALHARALAALGSVFPGRLLRLPVLDKGNEVALGLAGAGPLPRRRQLARRAEALEVRLGVEARAFTRVMRRGNGGLLGRLW